MQTVKPIELRLVKHKTNGHTFYTVNKIWAGVGNISFGQRRFMTCRDATDWACREWYGVPLMTTAGV
jgi:hypothetical protein